MIYQPAEDTFLMQEVLEKELPKLINNKTKFLEIGCGSGYLLEVANKFLDKSQITGCDINPEAVKYCKTKGFNVIQSDLFSTIPDKFDIIIFNPPYLPEDKREDKESQLATTGGKKGDEVIKEFLKQAKQHLSKEGKIFLLVSSLTPSEKIHGKVIARKKLFMEELTVIQIEA
jgi:release factor glutamine methyltransferase